MKFNEFFIYTIFVNYGTEGWKVFNQTNSFDSAAKYREDAMKLGNNEVFIFKTVKLKVSEIQDL